MAYYRRQYQNYQPVAKFMSPDHIQGFCTAEEAPKLVQHLRNYSGTYHLMTEMRDKFNGQNGFKQSGLSEKQWSIVRKNMQIETPAKPFTPVTFAEPVDIVINKSAAFSHFKKKLGMKYGIFTLRVHNIKSVEKSRGGNFYKITMDVSPNADGTVSACRYCGKMLTDPTSIATGIGPACAKHTGVPKLYKQDVQKFMEGVKREFAKVGITEMTTWHANIIQGVDPIIHEIKEQMDKPVDAEHVTVSAEHIEWVPKNKSFSIDLSMDKHSDIKRLYDVLKTDKIVYVNVVNPKTTNWVKFVKVTGADNNFWVFKPVDVEAQSKVESLIVKS